MATLSELARRFTSLRPDEVAHLRRLIGSWAPLADLSFSDLLLWATVDKERAGSSAQDLIVLGQIRPTTAQTVYLDDQVGSLAWSENQVLLAKALATGKRQSSPRSTRADDREAIPVRYEDRLIAVLSRASRPAASPRSELETAYLGVFGRMSTMLADGTFPFPFEDAVTEESPRVGDGAIILDAYQRVTYSSPNAVSALHRLGYHGQLREQHLGQLGFDEDLVSSAYRLRVPVLQELERGENATILCRIVPLVENAVTTAALVLLRDVSDVRRRDRMLVSMDTTIREIHHRVKNNLQTVSSLLRLQGRRLESTEAKSAIEESVRRIASIAVVHELLAKNGGDEVRFRDVLQPIVASAASTLVGPDRPIEFRLVGEGPTLPASKASSLAVVVTELLQNAVEHGYPNASGGVITVEMITSPTEVQVRVHDDGVGVGADFDVEHAKGLGLTIVSTMVTGELAGELVLRPALPPQTGTIAQVVVRLVDRR